MNNHSQISLCLNNKNKSAKSYIFIHTDEDVYDNFQDLLNSKGIKSRIFNVYKKEDNSFVMTSDNQTECAELLNLDKTSISACLRSKIKSHKGYLFYSIDNDPNLKAS